MDDKAEERRAPVQGDYSPGATTKSPPGTISWTEHLEAWEVYADKYGGRGPGGQSAERIAERHGFSYLELCDLLGHKPTTWQPLTHCTKEDGR